MQYNLEADTVCNVLPIPLNNNGFVIVKLKPHLRYRGYVYNEPVRPSSVHEALNYLKRKNNFLKEKAVLWRYFHFLWFKQSRNAESARHFSY